MNVFFTLILASAVLGQVTCQQGLVDIDVDDARTAFIVMAGVTLFCLLITVICVMIIFCCPMMTSEPIMNQGYANGYEPRAYEPQGYPEPSYRGREMVHYPGGSRAYKPRQHTQVLPQVHRSRAKRRPWEGRGMPYVTR